MPSRLVSRGTKVLAGAIVVVAAGAVGQFLSTRLLARGDEESDTFTRAAILSGQELDSRSTALRSASALAVMGGVEIDLRGATLGPGTPTLSLTAVMGGVEVRLPRGWKVHVENRKAMGEVETRLTEPSELPEDAPTLLVITNNWFGGIEIRQDR